MLTRRRTSFDPSFRPVWVWPHSGNGPARVLSWVSYGATSLVAGLCTRRADLVLASSPHLLTGVSGWVLSRVWRVPFLLEVRDLWPDVLVDMGALEESSTICRFLRRLERFLYRHAAVIVVLAEGVSDRLISVGVDSGRIVVVPNGADPSDFDSPFSKDELRARYGLSGFVVVYAGSHGPANGLDLVLDAAGSLADTEPDALIVLVGDGASKKELVARAEREGLANVRFLDPIPKSEMPALLKAADAGLHVLADVPLFRYGVSPNKLYDYLAAGLPTITNTPGEVTALLSAADAGIPVAPEGIANGVLAMSRSSSEERQRWSENGRAWMAVNRSRRALAARLEDVLDRATDR